MPGQLISKVKERIENRGFKSVSDYIKFLIKEDDDFLTDDEILTAVKEADRDYKLGKLKVLKSLDDL
ncbi:TPA: hypothetical protein DDY55_02350 [Candidatus Falkowbacteria bacterium]|nr:hypothetical protein [Candidatus Falkowbacteria bacterium]HAY12435.1 hypothetical protein [Candidatus Falkowbacteria bacterium]HBI96942.1 hypothetical protein [Candidatus Falkowbacteria bacterium]HBT27600.1 hypothetical protein [Candidatus Falkowbacteria bacterium]HBY15289.1 hypothetical protein [Candidatus Falkowbacteria bacterium]